MNDAEAVPPWYLQRLDLCFYYDTNFVTDDSPAAEELRRLHRDGWINLVRTDVVDTELLDQKEPEKRAELLDATADYVESRSPAVDGHSRPPASVRGSQEDEDRLDRVYRILWPDSDRSDESTNAARRKLRDTMHVAAALRYGATGFVTRDEGILQKTKELAQAFDGFVVMTPDDALAFAQRMVNRWSARQRREP